MYLDVKHNEIVTMNSYVKLIQNFVSMYIWLVLKMYPLKLVFECGCL